MKNLQSSDNIQSNFINSDRDLMHTVRMRSSRPMGITGQLAENITKNWLMGLRETNPGILDMFHERDMLPYREMLPWLGEFPGKYITGAYYIYRLTLNRALYDYIITFIEELMECQAEDGYLGVFSRECRLTGSFSQKPDEVEGTWDAWNHYHIMYGLLLWYEETGNARYLECVEKAADLFLEKFYNPSSGRRSLLELKSSETNLAPIHAFALLYRLTGKQRYLAFASEIEKDLADEHAGNYINCALNGIEYYQCPKPRWESLHIILGLAELYRTAGYLPRAKQEQSADTACMPLNPSSKTAHMTQSQHAETVCTTQNQLPGAHYLQTVKQIYHSIRKTDVHNTGAFSTDEQAIGTPFKNGNIETCCVIAYNALAVELFRLTGDVDILDFLELSHYNACMGAWSPTGRWSTYHTPMAGERHANFHDISFQSRAGSPELNCCSVNAPRAVGMLNEWAFTRTETALCINAYEDGEFVTEDNVRIRISGGYPAKKNVEILIKNYAGELALRIPGWSAITSIASETLQDDSSPHATAHSQDGKTMYAATHSLNGEILPAAGSYCRLHCQGSILLRLHLDFTTRYLAGKEEYDGCVSIYRGPILFGTDIRLAGGHDLSKLPMLSRKEIENTPSISEQNHGRILIPLSCGVTLGDFCHLGQSGCRYTTWVQMEC